MLKIKLGKKLLEKLQKEKEKLAKTELKFEKRQCCGEKNFRPQMIVGEIT